MQANRVVCGGNRDETENLTFSGDPEENPVEFLKKSEAYINRINPLMEGTDQIEIINRVLKGWACT